MVGDLRRANVGGLGLVGERRVADGGDDDDKEAGDGAVRHLLSLVQHLVGGAILSLSKRWERLLEEKNKHWGLISSPWKPTIGGFAKM
ncbi:hypothetical protein GW17_00009662 [Ensete ventricosum]|nr:hypothetical protein GW17_00009662 [Ensete ventricosum]RZR88834.1 hypothetical protein BHM03_00016475 [Ensete ventricosum]